MAQDAANIEAIRSTFDAFDQNGDNKISLKELSTMLFSLNLAPTEEEIKEIMNRSDTNKNGYLDFDEFAKLVDSLPTVNHSEAEMMEAFKVFDTDGNGTLDKEELRAVLGDVNMSQEEIDGMFEMADTNKDGKIQYDEFVRFMCELTS